ncbi:MAG: hypothetical protein R3E67_01530 [Pseudomonadales bacterium]
MKERNPVHYLLFITYFPHLIAVLSKTGVMMMPQFAHAKTYRISQGKHRHWSDNFCDRHVQKSHYR